MSAAGVGKVIATKSTRFQFNDWVSGVFGMQKYCFNGGNCGKIDQTIIDALGGVENYIPTCGLSASPTAYIGIEIIASDMVKKGKTLVVSGAAGNVGQWVTQLGKVHYGMKVVGIAGSDEKCKFLLEELGCDGAINYKKENVRDAISRICPEGVDLYFDNVGGDISEAVYEKMNNFGRVIVCGIISSYNSEPWKFPGMDLILVKRLCVQGFIVSDHFNLVPNCIQIVSGLVLQKKVKFFTQIELKGIDKYTNALDDLWSGNNIGKVYFFFSYQKRFKLE